jgi:hypothetical protein
MKVYSPPSKDNPGLSQTSLLSYRYPPMFGIDAFVVFPSSWICNSFIQEYSTAPVRNKNPNVKHRRASPYMEAASSHQAMIGRGHDPHLSAPWWGSSGIIGVPSSISVHNDEHVSVFSMAATCTISRYIDKLLKYGTKSDDLPLVKC